MNKETKIAAALFGWYALDIYVVYRTLKHYEKRIRTLKEEKDQLFVFTCALAAGCPREHLDKIKTDLAFNAIVKHQT